MVKIVSEQEISRSKGNVVHRSAPTQYMVPWEERGQGSQSVVGTQSDDDEDLNDQSKYIMIPPHRRSVGSSLLVPRAPHPRGPVEAYGQDLREWAMVPFRRAQGWVRLVDERA